MNERLLSERHWGEVTLNQGEVTCPSEGVMG